MADLIRALAADLRREAGLAFWLAGGHGSRSHASFLRDTATRIDAVADAVGWRDVTESEPRPYVGVVVALPDGPAAAWRDDRGGWRVGGNPLGPQYPAPVRFMPIPEDRR